MSIYNTDPALFIFTSLTSGSSHIVTATSRLETILRANRVPFKAVDIATDDKARSLWGRRAGKDESGRVRKLPALIQDGFVVGDLVEIEDWNEYGELKQHVKIFYDEHTIPNINQKLPDPIKPKPLAKPSVQVAAAAAGAAAASVVASQAPPAPPLPQAKASTADAATPASKTGDKAAPEKTTNLPMRSIADEAAQKAKELRLRTLREKVHGKATDGATKDGAAAKEPVSSDKKDEPAASAAPEGCSTPGLQSPTSGTWKNSGDAEAARDMVQSPTSAKWKQGATELGSPTSRKGPATVAASKKEEEDSDDDDDDDDDDEDEEDESEDDDKDEEAAKPEPKVDNKPVAKEQTKKETEADDDDSDDDDDDEDDSDDDEEEETKPQAKQPQKEVKKDEQKKVEESDSEEEESDDDEDEEEEKPVAKPVAEPVVKQPQREETKDEKKVEPAAAAVAKDGDDEDEDSDDSDESEDEKPAKK